MHVVRRSLAILLLAGCGFLAVYLGLRSSHRSAPATLASSATAPAAQPATSTPTEQTTESASEPPMPETLPDVRVPDLSGNAKSLRDFLGHPLIVNFWATWCEPCRREMPLLAQLQQQYRPNGLQIVGIAIDSRPAVQQYLKQRPVDYPILADEEAGTAAMTRFGAQPVLPFSVFTDAQGRIVVVKMGELHPEEASYILTSEQELAAGHQTLEQTRTAVAAKLRDFAIARAKATGGPSPP